MKIKYLHILFLFIFFLFPNLSYSQQKLKTSKQFEQIYKSIVEVRSFVPENARTARSLGTERLGTGVVIDKKHILTIGYIVIEAEKIDKMELLKSVDKILQKPELFSNALFQLRADDLINSKGPTIYKSRLSGYLLAIELLGSLEFWKNKDIVLIGNPDLTEMYQFVLNKKVKSIKKFLSSDMVLKGLKNFKKNFNKFQK